MNRRPWTVNRCFAHGLWVAMFLSAVQGPRVAYAAPGTIRGLVTFPGETPPPAMYANRDDHDCPHGIAQNHLEVDQGNLGLHNALVVLDFEGAHEVHDTQLTLRTHGCTLQPRVQWAPLAVSVKLINEDGAHHRLSASLNEVVVFEVPLEPGQTVRRPLVRTGLYQINCSRHPWERAWIYASDHPYAAVTDRHGRFEIKNVPPGEYRLRAWHEGWETRGPDPEGHPRWIPMDDTETVRVKSGQASEIRFDRLEATLLPVH